MNRVLVLFFFYFSVGSWGGEFEKEFDLNQVALTCTKNIASAQNVWDVSLEKWIEHPSFLYSHRFTRWFVYDDGAAPEVCELVKALQGQKVVAQVKGRLHVSTLSQCVEGGIYYCKRWGCFRFLNEFASLVFPNGLELRSEVYDQSPQQLHQGHCE